MSTYRIVIGYSSSPSYAEAVRLASELPGYEEHGSGRAVRHRAPIALHALAAEDRLLGLVRGWRNAVIMCDGEALDRTALWAMSRVLSCYRAHELGGLEELHCLGLPGAVTRAIPCRLMNRSLPWTLGHEYREAELLPRLLQAHARRTLADVCPAYDLTAISHAVNDVLARSVPARGVGLHAEIVHSVSIREARRSRERLARLLADVDVTLEQ